MQYLITYVDDNGTKKAFYTNWFDVENNFNSDAQMIVFDLLNDRYMVNGLDWNDIPEDHL